MTRINELRSRFANRLFSREEILEMAERYAKACPSDGMAQVWLRRAHIGSGDWYMAVNLAEACEKLKEAG